MSIVEPSGTKETATTNQENALEQVTTDLLARLEQAKTSDEQVYPVTLKTLAEAAGVQKSRSLGGVLESVAFNKRVVLPWMQKTRRSAKFYIQRWSAPLAFREDIALLAESDQLLKFAFLCGAKESKTRGFSISDLAKNVGMHHGLNEQFKSALTERLESGTLPKWVGGIPKGRTIYLFRMDDIVTFHGPADASVAAPIESSQPKPPEPVKPTVPPPSAPTFAEEFDAAFARLDRDQGFKNFVKLHDLRQALSQYSREEFDASLNDLRRKGIYALDSAEGGYILLSEEERAAGVSEAGSNLVYCSRR